MNGYPKIRNTVDELADHLMKKIREEKNLEISEQLFFRWKESIKLIVSWEVLNDKWSKSWREGCESSGQEDETYGK